ncbi:putative serine esterase [Colletotrichum chlorophyti]|uniref:Putative serine esterase n=1 Tax=Colletotrichum chlorophyti TaxID=708187 RepID=A0A1Q8RX92_9PEZI|nr:putative serine esterase [Colletotrichum chlorophyti]
MASPQDIAVVDETTYSYIFEKDVSVPLKNGNVIRCNIYRPKGCKQGEKYPVLACYGPYGKDIPYASFHPASFKEVDPAHQTEHSSWETPTPEYWTAHGYVVVRADEIGTGQSPGFLNPLSRATDESYHNLVEWASEQPWSTGKVGLLGISYFAATQWKVAATQPKGLAAIVPWEGFSDDYRDVARHGGILSDKFLKTVYAKQIGSVQYGLPGRAARNWGPDTVEGDMNEEELRANRRELIDGPQKSRFRDDEHFSAIHFNLEDVRVPLLSVANWGGIMLHLRGNVQGFMHASSEYKYLRFIVGRHDLPFYYPEEVEVQRSFLDAFLKGEDRVGWSRKGAVPPVDLILRKGDIGHGNPQAMKLYPRRKENEWPIARTRYNSLFLSPERQLSLALPEVKRPCKLGYRALGNLTSQQLVSFVSAPFDLETEVTGHIVVHLNVSVAGDPEGPVPSDIDLFLTLRHLSASGQEIFYTGTHGDAAPIVKGFLRVSLRKTNPQHPRHRSWLPHRDYLSTDVLPVIPNEVYPVDVEMWPTNVVFEKGERLVLDVSSGDTPGCSVFEHIDPDDRSEKVFRGTNFIHFGPQYTNSITLPIIPPADLSGTSYAGKMP